MRDESLETRLKSVIRNIPDFPQSGIQFKDITPILLDPTLFEESIEAFAQFAKARNAHKIIGVDARGFLFAAPVANRLGVGLVVVRKEGKLPYETHRESYALEYGTNTLELHTDAIADGENVVVIDDLLATGGTTEAAIGLVKAAGGKICGLGFVIELGFLNGRDKLDGFEHLSLAVYE